MMDWKTVYISIFIFLTSLKCVFGITDRVRLLTCDSNNRRIMAARVSTGDIRGKLECYYEPQTGNYLFRIRINKLNLAKQGSLCPTVTFKGFTSKMLLPDEDPDWQFPDRGLLVPADPIVLIEFNCNNYQSATNKIFETSTVGQKLLFIYDSKNINQGVVGAVDFTITSYINGPSYRCPDMHFRCWSTSHVCIDQSLVCDQIDNCYDNSDEDNFKCSGKVAGIYLPMFIIMLLLLFLVVIGVIIAIVLICRRRNRKIAREAEARQRAIERKQQTPYYLPSQPTRYMQPPPEVGANRKDWQQLQMEQQHHSKSNGAFDNGGVDC